VPALLPVAWYRMLPSGPAVELITSSRGPATNSRQLRKMKPVNTPMATQYIMILGPSSAAFGISSIYPVC